MTTSLRIVILGLSIRSSWGNGHATTYRALAAALVKRGHHVLFLERDKPWYASHADPSEDLPCEFALYGSLDELKDVHGQSIEHADLVIVGSYVPDGIEVGSWVQACAGGTTAFYDIDTPVTLASLSRDACDYLSRHLVPGFHLYLTFTGGPVLDRLEREFGAPMARPLYCSVDPDRYSPQPDRIPEWDLGYLGTYSGDRQRTLHRLLIDPAQQWTDGRFIVAGARYPADIRWPASVCREEHIPPADHRAFYCSLRFALNVTRNDMIRTGWSPSVRLFEAAACGTPIIGDAWPGLESFLTPGREILVARTTVDVLTLLRDWPEERRIAIGAAARHRILNEHTPEHRAEALEAYVDSAERAHFPVSCALTTLAMGDNRAA